MRNESLSGAFLTTMDCFMEAFAKSIYKKAAVWGT